MAWYLDHDHRRGMEYNIHVCEVQPPHNRVCFMANAGEETEDRAKVIAAAPDLLEALKSIVDGLGSQPGYASTQALQMAKAAIAKATYRND